MTAWGKNRAGFVSSLAKSTESELNLLDISVASPCTDRSKNFIPEARALTCLLAENLRQLTVKSGWANDSIYLAAWLVVQGYLLGQPQVRLNQLSDVSSIDSDKKNAALQFLRLRLAHRQHATPHFFCHCQYSRRRSAG